MKEFKHKELNVDNAKRLYNALRESGYDTDFLGDENYFVDALKNKEDRDMLWEEVALRDNFNIGARDWYENELTAPTTSTIDDAPDDVQRSLATPKPASQPASKPQPQVAQKPQGGTPFNPQGKGAAINNMLAKSREVVSGMQDAADKTRRMVENAPMNPQGQQLAKAHDMQRQMNGQQKPMGLSNWGAGQQQAEQSGEDNKPMRSMQSPQPYGTVMENGERKQQWLLGDGTVTSSYLQADAAETQARGARLQHEFTRRMQGNGLDPAKKEDIKRQQELDMRDELMRQLDKQAEVNKAERMENAREKNDAYSRWKKEHPFLSAVLSIINDGDVGNANDALTIDGQQGIIDTENALDTEADFINQTRQKFDVAGNGGGTSLLNGLRNPWLREGTYSFGASDLRNAMALSKAQQKQQRGEELSDAEQSLMTTAGISAAADELLDKDTSAWYSVGSITSESIPFMFEMATNPLSGVGKAAMKYAVKRMGVEAVKKLTRKQLMTKIAARALGDVVGSAGMAATTGTLSVLADAERRRMGDVVPEYDQSGRVIGAKLEGGEGYGTALAKSFGARTIENWSEMVGEYFSPLINAAGKGVSKGLQKVGLGKVVDWATNVSNSAIARQIGNFESRVKFNGTIGEWAEEQVGTAANALLIGDSDWSDLVDARQQAITFGGVALMGGTISAIKAGVYPFGRRRSKKKLDQANENGAEVYGERWNDIVTQFDEGKFEDVFPEMMRQAKTQEEKEAIVDYGRRLQTWRGYNIIDEKRRIEQIEVVEDDMRDSFDKGADTDINDNDTLNQIKIDYDNKVEAFTRAFGDAPENVLADDGDYTGQLIRMKNAGQLTEEQATAAIDYLNAKAKYDGASYSFEEGIDAVARKVRLDMQSTANKNGRVIAATTKVGGNEVYVIGGDVVADAEGNIDYTNSSTDIVIKHKDTGDIEYSNINNLSTATDMGDMQQLSDIALANATAEYNRKRDMFQSGKVDTTPGAKVSLRFEDGEEYTGTIAGRSDEGKVIVNWDDGSVKLFSDAELQDAFDRYNWLRVSQQDTVDAAIRYALQQDAQQQTQPEQPQDEQQQFDVGSNVRVVGANGGEYNGVITEKDEDGYTVELQDEQGNTISIVRKTADELAAMQPQEQQPIDETQQPPVAENPMQPIDAPETEQPQQPTDEQQPEQPSALAKVPVGEDGAPKFEKAEPETAYDAIEEMMGNEEDRDDLIKQTIANLTKQIDKASKKVNEIQLKGNDYNRFRAEKAAARQQLESLQQQLEKWNAIAGVGQHRAEAAKQQALKEAEQREAEARLKAEQVGGVPEMALDKPQDARARGFRNVNGEKVYRQEPLQAKQGEEVSVMFSTNPGDTPKGRVAVIEAGQLQPSHIDKQRNPLHFIDEAQPKERTDQASMHGAMKIASGIRPEIITTTGTAYTGAPTVNTRGEVIQGNNRSAALKMMYDEYTQQADKYKQYLIDHAEEFGLSKEDIIAMEQPVLVTMLDVNDNEAIRLGQFVAQDTESGGQERIKAGNTIKKLGGKVRSFFNVLLQSKDDEMSIAQLIDANGITALKWLRDNKIITDTQYTSALDSKGNLNAEAKNDLRNILYKAIFEGGSTRLEEMFNNLPAKAQKAILATAYRDFDSPAAERIVPELQNAIEAFTLMLIDKGFASAKNSNEARRAMNVWAAQTTFGPNGEIFVPSRKYSNFALELAVRFKGDSQNALQGLFNELYDLIQGAKEDNLFETSDKTPKTLAQAIKQTLNIDYNGQNERNALVGDNQESEERRQGADATPDGGEQAPQGKGTTDGGGRTDADGTERGIGERIASAEADVNTEPTDKQKEAGNYKKGHVKIGSFDVTIENPKGSVRSGVGADGKRWSNTMNNTYGYIRGAIGVDGDHIDVYLSNDIDNWSGEKVYVIDVYNPDGSFDEHKVMLGFNDAATAREDFLKNYDEGWSNNRRLDVSEVNLADFEKWVNSSKRKTKPFADYKSVKTSELIDKTKEEKTVKSKWVNDDDAERFEELRKQLKAKLRGQMNMGVDPEIFAIGVEMSYLMLKKGARKFREFAKGLIEVLGDEVRPYIKSFYNGARDLPEMAEYEKDMTPYEEVRSFDVLNFDKEGGRADVMATAEHVSREADAERDAKIATEKLKQQRSRQKSVDKADGKKEEPQQLGGLFGDTNENEAPKIAVPEQRPETELSGDSAEFQQREVQTAQLVEEIGAVISSRVDMLRLDPESVKPLTMGEVKKIASKYPLLSDISDTDLQELVELAMTQITREAAIGGINGNAEQQRAAYDRIVSMYRIQPNLNARDSERLMKQQYSTPTPFGYVMGQFVRAFGKKIGSVLEPSAGNGALTIALDPKTVHANDIDDARLANLRKLGFGSVTAQNALLPFKGEMVDAVMTNPPFGTVTEKMYDGVFRITSLEGQMAINALDSMKNDGRAAIVIGGNTSYRENGSMNPKDAAFFGYLYSRYNVVDVINISGKALYSRNGTGYDVRMILIDGHKSGELQRVYPPVKAKARAEQVTTFDELYKRVQDDIQQIQQVGDKAVDVQREPERPLDRGQSERVGKETDRAVVGTGIGGKELGGTPVSDIEQSVRRNAGGGAGRLDNGNRGDAAGTDDVQRGATRQSGQRESDKRVDNGRGGNGGNVTDNIPSRPGTGRERLAVKPGLTAEKVDYPSQSGNGFTLLSVVPAAQAKVLQKSLAEIGDVDNFLVEQLGYSSKEELYGYLAAEQIDSVALAIHQMNKGNAFIIGDMTGVGKGRQGAALIRYAVKQGKVPIYFTQKSTLFTDNYRDLTDIGCKDLRPFIIASDDTEHSPYIKDVKGNVIYKLPREKEKERVFDYIMKNGKLPAEYDYVITVYSQIQNGILDYEPTEIGWTSKPKDYGKKDKVPSGDLTGQKRRDVIARLAEGNIIILDESHTVGGDSGSGRYMQMLTSQAGGVTFMSATFAKKAENMPIYAQRTAISEAGIKPDELIRAIAKGGVTLQEIMSKQLVESGQMIRRERSFEGVTIDWLNVSEETDRKQRAQFNEVADIFNSIRSFQDEYVKPVIEAMSEAAAERGAAVGQRKGTKDLGVKNVPFASKMYNLVNQLLFALKADAVSDRVIENLKNGRKPVISFTNTMEGFLEESPKGVEMDEVPNFAVTLMRALNGVMRYTENDADKNSEGGIIPLSYLSVEGQKAYNDIRTKIEALSEDLPISPMDAIRAKIEDAGYTIAEITGRKLQLNKTANGKYIVEDRKDKDANKSMRDFNSGKLDVLMINKSGSTGISLHASSKFADQRQRVMVFAQFQSDINDEVQMRGRIDRSGQVVRGKYEYIMSTIPAEQRLQMMFKAKLKSLDANTTSSQKSKFNEMEVVDYLNKYGDEVVWEYMKEHPELEERLGDPLEILKGDNEETDKSSKKEDKSKKEGCAAKISRYLAFLSVEEQDEIFREITEAYKVKMQLLDDAGENDLEITTMPLRAETKGVKIWHKGTAPNSGNAFADNTYVEEVECDVLKKPMKRSEIDAAMKKLMGELYTEKKGGVDWMGYIRRKNDEIAQYFSAKTDDTIAKLSEQGEARIAKAREKAVKDGEKARGRGENNFTDEQIQTLADTMAAEVRTQEEHKQQRRREEIMAVRHRIGVLMQQLVAGSIYVVPQDLKNSTADMFTQTYGTFVGFKFNKNYTLGSSTAVFATLDGRRKVELALNDRAIDMIIQSTDIARRYSPKDIGAISLDNWDSKVPTQTRQKRYIITGNLLQALVDTEKGNGTRGNLISYSTIDGETRQGILMGENFKPSDLRSSATLSSRLAQIKDGKTVVSEDGDVQISKILLGWEHKGDYELRVPKSKQRGGIYTMNDNLLSLVWKNNFVTKGGNMVAYVSPENIARVVDLLSREPFNLTVLEESKLEDTEDNTVEEKVEKYSARQRGLFGDAKQNPVQLSMFDSRENIDEQINEAEQKANDAIGAFADVYSRYADEEDANIYSSDSENPNNSVEAELIQAQNDFMAALTDFYKQNGNSEEDAVRMAKDMLAQVRSEVEVSRIFLRNAKQRGIYKLDQEQLAKEERQLQQQLQDAEKQQETEQPKKQKNTCETAGGEAISVESSGGLPKLKRGEFAVVERQFAIDKNFTFDGKAKIESIDDVAYIFRQLESYCVEHAFAMLVKDGKPTIVHLGMGTFSATQVNTGALRAAVDEFGADSIYFIHNHPSGTLKPSFQDQNLFNELQNMFKGKKVSVDAIIIDTTSGKYVQFGNGTTMEGDMPKNVDGAIEYPVHSFSKQVFNDVEVPQKVIRSSSDVAEVLSTLRLGKRNKLGFLLLNRAHQVVGNIFSNYGSYNRAKDIADEIVKYALHYGADSVVTYGNVGLDGVDKVKSEVSRLSNRSVTLLDGINVANGLSAVDSGVMESGVPYEKGDNKMLRDVEDIEAINERFNQRLDELSSNPQQKDRVLHLGVASSFLQSGGVPNAEILLEYDRLIRKSNEGYKNAHPFEAKDIKNLPKAISEPIAVFANTSGNEGHVILTELKKGVNNFIVVIKATEQNRKGGVVLIVNEIVTLFPKEAKGVIGWINNGKATRIDKEKALRFIEALPTHPGTTITSAELDDATKVVKEFENPSVEGVKKSEEAQMAARVQEIADGLNTPVRIVQSEEEMSQLPTYRKRHAKGWFDTTTGEVVIVVPNNENMADVENTVAHEIVAHKGLRKLVGDERFDGFLDEVYNNLDSKIKATVDARVDAEVERRAKEIADRNGGDAMAWAEAYDAVNAQQEAIRREQTEEYMAELAGRIAESGFEQMSKEEKTLWGKVKERVIKFIDAVMSGLGVKTRLTDKELAYILYRSWKNLRDNGTLLDEAEDIDMRRKTGFNEKQETNEPTDPNGGGGIRYRVGDMSPEEYEQRGIKSGIVKKARDIYENAVSKHKYKTIEAFQDSMRSLLEMYKAISGNQNLRIEDIASFENAYTAENEISSKNKAEQHEYEVTLFRPLAAAISKLTKGKKKAEIELNKYLIAKHGLERNEVLARRDAQRSAEEEFRPKKMLVERALKADPDNEELKDELKELGREQREYEETLYGEYRQNDYSGLTSLMRDAGEDKIDVPTAEQRAQEFVDGYETDNDTANLWECINNCTKSTLKRLHTGGIISTDVYERTSKMFEYYIPLRGYDETTSDEVYSYLNDMDSMLRGNVMKSAKGRSSVAYDPIATISQMADSAIIQANRNEMKQKFLNFVQNHPSDAVSVKHLWLRKNEVTGEWEPVFCNTIEPEDTPDEVAAKIEEFEQRMNELVKEKPDMYRKDKGSGKNSDNSVNIPYRVVGNNINEHQVLVRRNGQTFVITINGNPRVAQALNGLTNPDVAQGGVYGAFEKFTGGVNRKLSAAYTTLNPNFMVSNFARDMVYANTMVAAKETAAYAGTFAANCAKFNPAFMGRMFYLWENGKLDDKNYYHRLFKEFMRNGGETGFSQTKTKEQYKSDVKKLVKRETSMRRKAGHVLAMQNDIANRAMENTARFAAFVTSRTFGRDVQRSVYDAKEVSVNFNKKGSGAKMYGAVGNNAFDNAMALLSGAGRALFVFWNAGVQGMNNYAKVIGRNPIKGTAATMLYTALGFAVPAMIAAAAGDGDDKDPNAYYNLPEHIRRQNICINAGDQWLTIPLPIELRAFYGLGELAYEAMSGQTDYDAGELALAISQQMTQLLPIDFLEGGGENPLMAFVPSTAKPVVEVVQNKSWTGLPIARENIWNENDPNWKKVYKNVNDAFLETCKTLSNMTGGNEVSGGMIDINPAKAEYLLKGYTGGITQIATQMMNSYMTLVGEKDFDWRNVPIATRFVKNGDERTAYRKIQDDYFDYIKEYEKTEHLLKGYQEQVKGGVLEYAEKIDFLNNSPEYMRYAIISQYKPIIDRYNKAKEAARGEDTKKLLEAQEQAYIAECVNAIRRGEDMRMAMPQAEEEELDTKSLYNQIATYEDWNEDIQLRVRAGQAKQSGNKQAQSIINKATARISKLKKQLGKDNNEDVINAIRTVRKNTLERLVDIQETPIEIKK